MKIAGTEFKLRELAGSMSDFGAILHPRIEGATVFLAGINLLEFTRDLRLNRDLPPLLGMMKGSLVLNMAVGFATGLAIHYLLFPRTKPTQRRDWKTG